MPSPEDIVVDGALGSHRAAAALAREVRRVHFRFAREIVAHWRLCPFVQEPAEAFGRFCVMLDREPELEAAVRQTMAAGGGVVHLVYPLVATPVAVFERFGNALHERVRAALAQAPVHATFHPRMEGDRSSPARLVGLVRRAPDPFVQFVPDGLLQGGTVYVDPAKLEESTTAHDKTGPGRRAFERLSAADIDAIEARLAEIRADRNRSYAALLDALAVA